MLSATGSESIGKQAYEQPSRVVAPASWFSQKTKVLFLKGHPLRRHTKNPFKSAAQLRFFIARRPNLDLEHKVQPALPHLPNNVLTPQGQSGHLGTACQSRLASSFR